MTALALPPRWSKLRPHKAQRRLVRSRARFDVVEAGRRAGKTELPKRLGVIEAVRMGPVFAEKGLTWFTKFCAPTQDQAKKIYWDDLKDLSRPWWVRAPHETDKTIYLPGAQIWVCGLDKPARVEGSPADRLAIDELAEVKDGAWDRNLYPALATPGRPPGRAWLYGVPRPGGQFLRLAELAKDPLEPDYAYHTWTSEGIVDQKVIDSARRTMDPLLFAQEFLAQRVSFEGRAYYAFTEQNLRDVHYDPRLPLMFCFDFNRKPGVAVVAQEQAIAGLFVDLCPLCGEQKPGLSGAQCKKCRHLLPLATCTCAVAEVCIPSGSNTTIVATKLVEQWGHHKGPIYCYGDASGGAHKSSSVEGSDWDLLRSYFAQPFPQAVFDVDKANPAVRARVNAVNLRCTNAAGERRLFTNPRAVPNLTRDLQYQQVLKGGSGELDKDSDKSLGHAADGLGYAIQKLYPATFGSNESIDAY